MSHPDLSWAAVAPSAASNGWETNGKLSGRSPLRMLAASGILIALLLATVVVLHVEPNGTELGISSLSSRVPSNKDGTAPRMELADATPADRFDPTTKGAQCYACADGVDTRGSKQDGYHIARLVGPDTDGTRSLCGRAEVLHNGQWGSICYEGWTTEDAQVFCKTMGLVGGTARYTDGLKPTWDSTTITHTAPQSPVAESIWMEAVSCAGSENNIFDCPFGGKAKGDPAAWQDYGQASTSNCNHAGDVGLCCDVSQFCPERSHWRPDQHDYVYQKQMFMSQMKPDQKGPEMLSNCKCDAGFYMLPSSVYGGRCEECMEHACSPVGSTSVSQCYCLPGFFMSDGQCVACPDNSCSPSGSTSIAQCSCFEGYFMNTSFTPECSTCPKFTTSHRGATDVSQCQYSCGLPPPPPQLGLELQNLATEVTEAESQRKAAAAEFSRAVAAKQAAVEALDAQVAADLKAKDTPPPPPSPTCDELQGVHVAGSQKCFLVPGNAATWGAAEGDCKARGGHLASIMSAEENDLVYGLYVNSGARDSHGGMWIGTSDDPNEISGTGEGHWQWSDGSAITYSSWTPGEPNDWGSGQDCGLMWLNDKSWDDQACDGAKPFVCAVQTAP
eukprot:CAMPEP_0181311094 /NCGR_PEP_ID=MMETSP1101-20121128/12947_1 /TAXON_ID=46948 /ORGANISM="Rhodomonas abbreviata, Strain Caron Lab Isolate" /LENGTH=614 /DNA_ID=CAMNT_0023417789 /DNA_START=130 /DNA_END=1971 /DNA_ORIENTATION=-